MQSVGNFYRENIQGNETLDMVLKGTAIGTGIVAVVSLVALAVLCPLALAGFAVGVGVKIAIGLALSSGAASLLSAIFASVVRKKANDGDNQDQGTLLRSPVSRTGASSPAGE